MLRWFLPLLASLLLLCGCSNRRSGDDPDDDDATAEPDAPDETFWVRATPERCTIHSDSVVFHDAETGDPLGDVPHTWAACFFDWTGDRAAEEDYITLLMMAPDTSGSSQIPGPRWLRLGMPGSMFGANSLPAARYVESTADWDSWARTVYVDTDSAEQAERFNGWEGIAWAAASGTVGLSALDGQVTPDPEADVAEDVGEVRFAFDLSDLSLTLTDGTEVDVEGELEISGEGEKAADDDDAVGDDDDDVSTYPYTFTCAATGAENTIDIAMDGCESQQETFAEVFSCNLIDEFCSACTAYYGCYGQDTDTACASFCF